MAELEKVRDGERSNIPRDLLQRFMSVGHLPVKLEAEASEDVTEELELTLGLSSNGRFGVDPRAKKIKRTSSIPEFMMKPVRDEDDVAYAMPTVMRCTTAPLVRSCSLPTETEEEWRKRKELQTLRRMEARRKRSEKQRNSKVAAAVVRDRNRASSEDIGEEDKRQEVRGVNGNLNEVTSLKKTTSLTRDCLVGLNLNSGLPPTPSSQGSGSSAISESESQPPPQGGERRRGMTRNVLEEMPCVSTKGEGPNGKRIQGFLYGHKKKGEEVRIVCVCHGTFLTPAEFVKHAGGRDVPHPLKHILVTPSFF